MASSSTTYQVQVQALWDNTDLRKNAELAEASIQSIAAEFGTTTDQVKADLAQLDTALSTNLSGGFRRTADDVEVEGNKLKASGKEIGGEFGQNLSQAFQSGDFAGAVTETFASLTPALGAIGIGLGVGALFVNNIIKGVAAEKEKLRQAGIAAFDALQDGVADKTEKFNLLGEILGTESIPDTIVRIRQLASETGRSVDFVRKALLGNAKAGAEVAAAYGETQRAIDANGPSLNRFQGGINAANKANEELFDLTQKVNQSLQDGKRYQEDYGNALFRATENARQLAAQLDLTTRSVGALNKATAAQRQGVFE